MKALNFTFNVLVFFLLAHLLYDFLVAVKAAPDECVIGTGQPYIVDPDQTAEDFQFGGPQKLNCAHNCAKHASWAAVGRLA